MNKYKMQMHDMNRGGAIVEVDYAVHWRPDRVNGEEVARTCAAEKTVFSGKNMSNGYKETYTGLSAVLVTEE